MYPCVQLKPHVTLCATVEDGAQSGGYEPPTKEGKLDVLHGNAWQEILDEKTQLATPALCPVHTPVAALGVNGALP